MSKLEEMFRNGWYPILKEHLHSESFRNLGKELKTYSNNRVEITPKFQDTFRAFQECPYSILNTIIIGTDPYPNKVSNGVYVADGLAFSSRDSKTCPRVLDYILNAIDETIYNGEGYNLTKSYDLKKWANQGVLLLNSALTLPLNRRTGEHLKIWNPFITYVLRELNLRKDNLGVILIGETAKSFKPLITNLTWGTYECEHPETVSYYGKKWNHENVFKNLNSYHKFLNNLEINWNI